MAAITIAKERRIEVFATTRQERKRAALEAAGADHVIIDDGRVAAQVRAIAPEGVDGLLELVGPGAASTRSTPSPSTGRACISGYLEDDWDVAARGRPGAAPRRALARYGCDVINVHSYRHVFAKIIRGLERAG